PERWDAHLYLGEALMQERRWEEAASHFQIAVRTAPHPGSIYYDLGQALIKAGHKEEGERALAHNKAYREFTDGANRLNKAIDAAPQDRSRRYALIRFCLSYHQSSAALAAIRDAREKLGMDATLKKLQAEAETLRAQAQANSAASSSAPS